MFFVLKFAIKKKRKLTHGPLVCSVHGHVAGVTRSTTANAEEEADTCFEEEDTCFTAQACKYRLQKYKLGFRL